MGIRENSTAKLNWPNAWALLSVQYAQGDANRASEMEVQRAGYFINNRSFLPEELEQAKNLLLASGLLSYENDSYLIGPKFGTFWEKTGAKKHQTVFKQLEAVKLELDIVA